jgi:hypothetical protein
MGIGEDDIDWTQVYVRRRVRVRDPAALPTRSTSSIVGGAVRREETDLSRVRQGGRVRVEVGTCKEGHMSTYTRWSDSMTFTDAISRSLQCGRYRVGIIHLRQIDVDRSGSAAETTATRT